MGDFGKWMRAERMRRGITLKVLSGMVGVSARHLGGVERGTSKMGDARMARVKEVLGDPGDALKAAYERGYQQAVEDAMQRLVCLQRGADFQTKWKPGRGGE